MKPEIGDTRYYVEYLDYAQGVTLMKHAGGDPENDSLLDYVIQPRSVSDVCLYR